MKLTTVGVIVNPAAGLGASRNLDLARQVINSLNPRSVVTGPGQMGGDALPQAHKLGQPEGQGRKATQFLTRQMADMDLDALIVIGGDGTLADVAFALADQVNPCPILGIGAGSTNVGDLITCRADAVHALQNARFVPESMNALVAGCNGTDLALAFNDVVIGATVVGTLAGEVCDLDATAFYGGERILGHPQPVASAMTLVMKRTGDRLVRVAQGVEVGTVVVGFAHYLCFYGKAIVGGVALTDLTGQPAGCLVCAQPLVRTRLSPEELAEVEPIRSSYISLSAGEVIQATGFAPPAVLCADGNPLQILGPDDVVHVRLKPDAVCVLRIQEGAE